MRKLLFCDVSSYSFVQNYYAFGKLEMSSKLIGRVPENKLIFPFI